MFLFVFVSDSCNEIGATSTTRRAKNSNDVQSRNTMRLGPKIENRTIKIALSISSSFFSFSLFRVTFAFTLIVGSQLIRLILKYSIFNLSAS